METISSRKQEREVSGVRLTASWFPKEGWGVRVEYSINTGKFASQSFEVWFTDDNREISSSTDYKLNLPAGEYLGRKRYDRLEYVVNVTGRSRTDWETDHDPEVRRFSASPEGLLKEGLASLDELEQLARKQITSGEALTVLDDSTISGGQPPEEHSASGQYELTDEREQEILGEALAEIERQRELLRENYRELHAAVVRAFPLSDCLTQADDK